MTRNEDVSEIETLLTHLLSGEEMSILRGLFSTTPLASFDELVDVVSPRLGYAGPGAWISVLRGRESMPRQESPDDRSGPPGF